MFRVRCCSKVVQGLDFENRKTNYKVVRSCNLHFKYTKDFICFKNKDASKNRGFFVKLNPYGVQIKSAIFYGKSIHRLVLFHSSIYQ